MQRFLCENPIVLFCIVLVGLNDHVFKHSAYAGFMTGKISDFAGTFFFPYLLCDLVTCIHRRGQYSNQVFIASLLATSALMLVLKTSSIGLQLFSEVYRLMGYTIHIVQDPYDLFALSVLPFSYRWFCHIRGNIHAR